MATDPADKPPFPMAGRLLGVDYGTKRIGLAVSTPEQTLSTTLENYDRRGTVQDTKHLQEVCREYRIAGIVVGLPVHISGAEGQKAHEARQYGDWLTQITGLPVRYWDERFTSAMAEEYLMAASLTKKKRKARLDMLAAQILLQNYLESGRTDAAPQALRDAPKGA